MTETPKRRGRAWKILGVVVGVIVACVAGLLLWVNAVAGRKFDEIDRRSKAMAAEWRARDAGRPVLRGAAEPGNAWDDYNPCLSEIKKTKDISRLGSLVVRDPKGDPEFGKAMLATHVKALELLRQGAGRATSRYAYAWEQGSNMQMPAFSTAQNLANLAVLQARALAEAGKPKEAAALLLDLCQFGRDFGDDGVLISEMIGSALLQLALAEARDLMSANLLDADSLRDLEAGLAVLETSFPRHARTLDNEAIYTGVTLRDFAASANYGIARLFFANAFERCVDWYGQAAKADALPWMESQSRIAVIDQESKSTWNPYARMLLPALSGTGRVGRHRRVQLRMIRIAAHYKAAGTLLDLDDPFGSKMKTSLAGDTLKIWSVGPDGVDDGGDGRWQDGKDFVLELKK